LKTTEFFPGSFVQQDSSNGSSNGQTPLANCSQGYADTSRGYRACLQLLCDRVHSGSLTGDHVRAFADSVPETAAASCMRHPASCMLPLPFSIIQTRHTNRRPFLFCLQFDKPACCHSRCVFMFPCLCCSHVAFAFLCVQIWLF